MPIINDFYSFLQYHLLEIGCYLKTVTKYNEDSWIVIIFMSGKWNQYKIRKKLADLEFYPVNFVHNHHMSELHITIEKI